MKLIFMLLIFFHCHLALCQWTANPGNPLRVCSKNSSQTGCWTFADGSGGTHVFWLDNRNGGTTSDLALVGQHFDGNGNRLLPDTGKVVVFNPTFKTTDFSIAKDPAGNFWVAWTLTTQTRMDSIVLQKFNKTTLNPIWNKTKTVCKPVGSLSPVLYTQSIDLYPTGDSLNIVYHVTWTGGGTVKFLNRASATGEIRFGTGKDFVGYNQNYGYSTAITYTDGSFILIQRNGNGAGTGVTAYKFDRKFKLNWSKSITTGTPGLGYAFEVVPDGNNGFIMGYITPISLDFIATRVDSAGNFVWSPAHKPICNYSSNQDYPDLEMSNGNLYAVWSDNRPPASNSDIFMQKINISTGERLWNPNGRIVFRLNSYIPVPRIMAQTNGDLIVTSLQNSTGFVAQRVKPDSTLLWPGYGMLIVSGNQLVPSYGAYNMNPGNNGETFVAWQTQSTAKIMIAGAAASGTLITENEPILESDKRMTLFPNPNAGSISLQGLPDGKQNLVISDLLGKELLNSSLEVTQGKADINHKLNTGVYLIRVGEAQMRMLVR